MITRITLVLCMYASSLITSPVVDAQTPAPSSPASPASLRTRWTADVKPGSVHPEYPRPQLVRARWTNLNGQWDYAIRDSSAAQSGQYDGKILVPFPVESHLSGVTRTVGDSQVVWYRRVFSAPQLNSGDRLLLHFGAVDWEAKVFVNGKQVGTHKGGYDPFSFDITDALVKSGNQEIVVRVWDPTDRGPQPRGKQVQNPGGIFYTPVTGIWQTVWLEPVPRASVRSLTITPDISSGEVRIAVNPVGAAPGERVRVVVRDGKRQIGETTGRVGETLTVRIPNAKLWSPATPFLYNLDVSLTSGDKVQSYFGMRSITLAKDGTGVQRIMLNGEPLFQYGLLDQGWWPDGLYTAPTDVALRFDIEETKRLGYNMIRKHVKVEPARWYYHADKLGMIVWQDMPSGNSDSPAGKTAFREEMKSMVDAFRNHPSIVMWVPLNEGWGQHDTERHARWLKQYDPSRLVNSASGWSDVGAGDVSDAHVYPGPGLPLPDTGSLAGKRAIVLGEFGGLGLPLPGHTWVKSDRNWGYQLYQDTTALVNGYRDLIHQLRFLTAQGLSAAVYTQTTDVETEANGVMTYDRAVTKLPADIAQLHATLYQKPPVLKALVPTSRITAQEWRYSFDTPDAAWAESGYDDNAWKSGKGGFGQHLPPGYARMPVLIGTPWDTPEIWMRRTFTMAEPASGELYWRVDHAGDVEIYLNGKHVGKFPGRNSGARLVALDSAARAALKTGTNTLAVYVHRTRPLPSFQFIDIGIDELRK